MVNTSFKEKTKDGVRTSIGDISCNILVDCRGVNSLINNQRDGVLLSAQYEVYADWIIDGQVEVYFDQVKYPGFFAWIIPSENGVSSKGRYSTIRKIFSPIWVNGPIKKFVSRDTVTVGDAAGQSKPTTAGGIYSCGMGGIMAGHAIAKHLDTKEFSQLVDYQKSWEKKFGKEFEKQRLARKILERVDNKTIDRLFDVITPDILSDISAKDDFDFHTVSIIKLLGIRNSLNTAQKIMGAEIKRVLSI
jgi:flavin-dependent dehydrogenase